MYHLMSNIVIDVHVISTAWSRWTFVVPGTNNQLEARYGGHYEDTVARENGHCKLRQRVAFNYLFRTQRRSSERSMIGDAS